MVVITRKRHQAVIGIVDGREIAVRVVRTSRGDCQLGFEGPATFVREEIKGRPRKVRSHLAGPPIAIGTYCVQRCMLCGEIMQEFDLAELKPGQLAPGGLTTGRFYEYRVPDDPRMLAHPKSFRYETHLDLPPNCCLFGG